MQSLVEGACHLDDLVSGMMLAGNRDIMAAPEDVLQQQSRLGSSLAGVFLYAEYGHMDFIWDRNAQHAADLVETFFRYSWGST
jgi:hypothetical protein